MTTFSLTVQSDNYTVLHHPCISNFVIIRHQTAEYMMMKMSGGKWRCLNDNPFCSYIPADTIYHLLMQNLESSKILLDSNQGG